MACRSSFAALVLRYLYAEFYYGKRRISGAWLDGYHLVTRCRGAILSRFTPNCALYPISTPALPYLLLCLIVLAPLLRFILLFQFHSSSLTAYVLILLILPVSGILAAEVSLIEKPVQ